MTPMSNIMTDFEKRVLADGRAVLFRGDSLAMLQAGLLPKWDALVSDPPYGIGFQHGGGGNAATKSRTGRIIGDDKPFDPTPWLEAATRSRKGALADKAVVLWGADHYKTRLPEGGRFICWDKSCGKGPAVSFVDAEFAWTSRRNPRCIVRHVWMGAVRAHDGFDGKTVSRHHVSQKPVSVMAWCLEHARIGIDEWVLDPYMGSGSTGVACLLTGRRFIGVEIDPAHFEVACQRIEKAWQNVQAGEILDVAV